MKKNVFFTWASILLLCLTSCSEESVLEEPEIKNPVVTVKFKLALRQEISSFQKTKNMPGNLPAGPTTKVDENVTPSNPSEEEQATPTSDISFVEYALYKNDDNSFVKHTRAALTANKDGSYTTDLQDGIKPGTYKVCFIAHGIGAATFDESTGMMTFPKIEDTFWGNDELEVTAEEKEKTTTVELTRAIAGIEFKATDAVPSNIYQFTIASSGFYNTLSILDGSVGSNLIEIPYSYLFKSEDYAADKRINHIIYTFAPESGEAQINEMSIAAKEKEGLIIRQKQINNIPIYRNRITRYTGTLYTPNITDTQFTLTINKEWGEYVEKDLDTL